ncbi:MAG: ISAzo13 family transposase [Elusimicrobia bacterium CG11_big_fil_rev_8_21_14_0_20_64_6]|nr:MAG: ISAzo13 family transposase [Elusimicrobia bacterium CG11_big_fil_rev_8_21_14_0_20_64_6]
MGDEAALKLKLAGVLPLLNEKQRRVLVASEAKFYGRGGIQTLSRITGMCRQTIYRGLEDLEEGSNSQRIRKPGGGRKKITRENPGIVGAIEKLIEPATRGDPMSPLRWSCKSVRNLEKSLQKSGYSISYRTISTILHEQEYRLQSNRKTSEGKKNHPDRNEQFGYINKQATSFLRREEPVISVDAKKKELIGKYKNPGREWRKKGKPIKVLSHDFPDPAVPKAVPYGVYDIGRNTGWVNVGVDADTAEFAVESIRQWWKGMGKQRYPKAKELLICADSGGSNGYRSHLWKRELQKLSDRHRLRITVCHFPPGTSKWNKIEHRLFSYISMNWRGRPLTDYQTVVSLIAATTTKTGLTVKARLDSKTYQRGIKVSAEEMESLRISPHQFHGEWNYTIEPKFKNV